MEIERDSNSKKAQDEQVSSDVTNSPDNSFFIANYDSVHLKTPIKERFHVLLSRLGRSQNWLADQVGISNATMSHIVNGLWFPTAGVMVRIAEILECDSVCLFGDSEHWKSYNEKIKYPKEEGENE